MGTRGFYVFKWRGRFYAYYNRNDSYPSGLGKALLRPVPLDNPEAYREWLEQTREIFSQIEAILERHIFSVPIETILSRDELPSLPCLGVEGLAYIPDYFEVLSDGLYDEWIYVIDLDKERLIVNGCCYFHLAEITPSWQDLLPEARKYFFGELDRDAIHSSIAEDEAPASVLDYDPSVKYQQLNPSIIEPKRISQLNRKPHFVMCKRLFEVLVKKYNDPMTATNDTVTDKSDFLFRELIFAMLCLASCSTDLVRLVSGRHIIHKSGWRFAGILKDPQPEFTASIFQGFHLPDKQAGSAPKTDCYWLSGVLVYLVLELGTEALVQDAIIDVAQRGRSEGREEFSAIIVSVDRAVLVRVLDGAVQHTRRLRLIHRELRQRGFGNEESRSSIDLDKLVYNSEGKYPPLKGDSDYEEADRGNAEEAPSAGNAEDGSNHGDRDEEAEGDKLEKAPSAENAEDESSEGKLNEDKLDEDNCNEGSGGGNAGGETPEQGQSVPEVQDTPQKEIDWYDPTSDQSGTFDAIAHLFEAQICRSLKPSTGGNHGRLPNEIYRRIVDYVDETTQRACLLVSRAFRDYASDVLYLSDGLKGVAVPNADPEWYHPSVGALGPFNPKPHKWRNPNPWGWGRRQISVPIQWFPVIGHADGTASYTPEISLWFDSLSDPDGEISRDDPDGNLGVYDDNFHDRLDKLFRQHRDTEGTPDHVNPDKEAWWYVFEVSNPKEHTTEQLACLYSAALFHHLRIIGCTNKHYSNYMFERILGSSSPWERARSIWANVAKRKLEYKQGDRSVVRPYCYTFIKQSGEDTPEGWARAEHEAKARASQAYLQGEYELWMAQFEAHETCKDFALLVIIGAKMKLFQIHLAAPLGVPLAKDTSVNPEDLRRLRYIHWNAKELDLWEQLGLDIQGFKSKIEWKPWGEMTSSDGNKSDPGYGSTSAPWDVLEVEHRPRIEEAVGWIAALADRKGPRDSEQITYS